MWRQVKGGGTWTWTINPQSGKISVTEEVFGKVVRCQEIGDNSIFEINFATYGEYSEVKYI